METPVIWHKNKQGINLAWRELPAQDPQQTVVVFFSGFRSNMQGAKAVYIEQWAKNRGRGCIRFDYSGHGESQGAFEEGTIGQWLADSLAILDQSRARRFVLVGSSMGGWIAFLAALARREKIGGIVGIAAAPDFVRDLLWNRMAEAQKQKLLADGVILLAGEEEYENAPCPITRNLVEEADAHLLLRDKIALDCPVRLLHGLGDKSVPWQTALEIARRLQSRDVRVIFCKNSGHRLSEPEDLALLGRILDEICHKADQSGA